MNLHILKPEINHHQIEVKLTFDWKNQRYKVVARFLYHGRLVNPPGTIVKYFPGAHPRTDALKIVYHQLEREYRKEVDNSPASKSRLIDFGKALDEIRMAIYELSE